MITTTVYGWSGGKVRSADRVTLADGTVVVEPVFDRAATLVEYAIFEAKREAEITAHRVSQRALRASAKVEADTMADLTSRVQALEANGVPI
jgi:hypothetical protein